MAHYVNPSQGTKEDWLARNGTPIPGHEAIKILHDGNSYPVCLIQNAHFTAAAICDTVGEVEAFLQDDGRPRLWYSVTIVECAPYVG